MPRSSKRTGENDTCTQEAAARWQARLDKAGAVVERALPEGLLAEPPHAVLFYDLDLIEERIQELQAAFPTGALHAVAVKACPITTLLRRTRDLGCGAEAATKVELRQALRAGHSPQKVVFDSPAKTREELQYALDHGVHLNADNLQELDRIAELVPREAPPGRSIGVRVNPGLRAGEIAATSTAAPGSKFGVSLLDDKEALLARFRRYPWLNALHLHVGSQGCSMELLVENARAVADLAAEIDELVGAKRITTLDLGGGLPATYRLDEPKPSLAEYARALEQAVPQLFTGQWNLITEFGRKVWANACFALSRVEYVKRSGGRPIATIHLGADMFVRTAYVPDVWHHEVSVLDSEGKSKGGELVGQDVAGPLCFSGDLVAKDRDLPIIHTGDHVLIHDVGAYTLSMWSRYNSRRSPSVYGFCDASDELELLRAGETEEDVLRFWD